MFKFRIVKRKVWKVNLPEKITEVLNKESGKLKLSKINIKDFAIKCIKSVKKFLYRNSMTNVIGRLTCSSRELENSLPGAILSFFHEPENMFLFKLQESNANDLAMQISKIFFTELKEYSTST